MDGYQIDTQQKMYVTKSKSRDVGTSHDKPVNPATRRAQSTRVQVIPSIGMHHVQMQSVPKYDTTNTHTFFAFTDLYPQYAPTRFALPRLRSRSSDCKSRRNVDPLARCEEAEIQQERRERREQPGLIGLFEVPSLSDLSPSIFSSLEFFICHSFARAVINIPLR